MRTGLAVVGGALVGAALAWGIVRNQPAQDAGIHSQFALLAERARKGVVNVHTRKTVVRPGVSVPDVPLPPGFRDFFGRQGAQGGAPLAAPSPRRGVRRS